jgi:phosphatidylserine decarboxylase
VEAISYRKGRFHDARHPKASTENESLTLSLFCPGHDIKVLVRQIAGTIARRIVCRLEPGSVVGRGEKYGMIKFGSRTELIVPSERVEKILVRIGSKVNAGSSILARIRKKYVH